MTEMNSYYAHDSNVGPVFDVAHFSSFKATWMGAVGLLFAAVFALAASYAWNPDWLLPHPPRCFVEAHQDVRDLARQHPLGLQIGAGVGGLLALLFAAAGISSIVSAVSAGYYIRVGENGISLRLPNGIFNCFDRDFEWSEIEKLTVVQEKYIGSSRNSGNIGGELRLRTRDGLNRKLRLDLFRENAWLIHRRIQEAMELRTAALA
jgi:hypothetical protein